MPYALCPMPYARRVPHVTEKGYSVLFGHIIYPKKCFSEIHRADCHKTYNNHL